MCLNLTNLNFEKFSFIDTSSYYLHLYAKDKIGRYLESNEALTKDLGFTKNIDIRGLSDFDLNFLSKEQVLLLQTNDKKVMSQLKSQTFIEPVTLFDERQVIALSQKMPLYSRMNSNKLLGMHGISIIIEKTELSNSMLTTREIECLYHLVKGKTAKQIAAILFISSRTVEQHLINCRLKLNCKNRQELIEKSLKISSIQKLILIDLL